MNRPLLIAMAALGFAGCNVAELQKAPDPLFTGESFVPPGTAAYSNQTYAEALRTASLKLRGLNAGAAEIEDVLANGQHAYDTAIDGYLDKSPAANDLLGNRMQVVFRDYLYMGGSTATVLDPQGSPVDVNMNEPANLAAYIIKNDAPWSDIIDTNTCIDDNLNIVPCSNPMPADQRAGVLTNQAFLKQFGQSGKFNFRRVSIATQLFHCKVYPAGDIPYRRTNSTAQNPEDVLPGDDPADPLRVHKNFQGMMGDLSCAGCHGGLLARRPAFLAFDENGFYDTTRRILHVETPEIHGNKCFVPPPGRDPDSLPSCDNFTPGQDVCCRDDVFTDFNSSDASTCNDPTQPCLGVYMQTEFDGIRELADLFLDEDLTGGAFTRCATTRLYNYVLGVPDLKLGLGASEGDPPLPPSSATVNKYRSLFEHENQSVRELLRALFKGDEYLSAQTL